jgi:hypothetical protein
MKSLENQSIERLITVFWFNLSRKSEMKELKTMFIEIVERIKRRNNLNYDDEGTKNFLEQLCCIIAYVRDIRYGKGERNLTYMMIFILHQYFPVLALYLVQEITGYNKPSYGSWKDIPRLCEYIRNESEKKESDGFILSLVEMANRQLKRDLANAPISNVAKWIPREKSKYGRWQFDIFIKSFFGLDMQPTGGQRKKYRKIISSLNRQLDTPEIKICEKRIEDIDLNRLTYDTWLKIGKKIPPELEFEQHYPPGNQENYNSFLSRDIVMGKGKELEFPEGPGGGKGEPGVPPKFESSFYGGLKKSELQYENTDLGFSIPIYSFIKKAIVPMTEPEKEKLDMLWVRYSRQWKPQTIQYNIPILDISAEMTEYEYYTAIGIGVLLSENSFFQHRLILFSQNASWSKITPGIGFTNSVKELMQSMPCPTTRNINEVFDLINSAIQVNTMKPCEIKNIELIVISNFRNDFENEEKIFDGKKGRPNITFWNISETTTIIPRKKSQVNQHQMNQVNKINENIRYVSGNISPVELFGERDTMKRIKKIISNERFDKIRQCFRRIVE